MNNIKYKLHVKGYFLMPQIPNEHSSFIKYIGIRLPVPSAHTSNTAHFQGVLKKMGPTW